MTSPADAVAYLDANVFIDAIEGPESISKPLKVLFDKVRPQGGTLVTSELTLAEVLAPSGDQRRAADLRRSYFDLIVWSGLVDLKPVGRDILVETATLRELSRLKLPDAIHLVTAIRSGCRFFVTRDKHFRQMPTGMERITAEPTELARVAEALA